MFNTDCADNRSDEAFSFCFSYSLYFAISSALKYSGKSGIKEAISTTSCCLSLSVFVFVFCCCRLFVCVLFFGVAVSFIHHAYTFAFVHFTPTLNIFLPWHFRGGRLAQPFVFFVSACSLLLKNEYTYCMVMHTAQSKEDKQDGKEAENEICMLPRTEFCFVVFIFPDRWRRSICYFVLSWHILTL